MANKFGLLQKALYDWANRETGLKVIWEEQAVQRPPKPYVAMKLINPSIPIGMDELRMDSGVTVVCGVRELVLSVNFYGIGALDGCYDLQSSLELPSVQDLLRANGLAYVTRSEVRNLSALLETAFESRTQMDVRFRTVMNLEDTDTGTIESVDITNELTENTETISDPDAP